MQFLAYATKDRMGGSCPEALFLITKLMINKENILHLIPVKVKGCVGQLSYVMTKYPMRSV